MHLAFNEFVASVTNPATLRHVSDLMARRDVSSVLALLDSHIQQFGRQLSHFFIDAGAATTAALTRKLPVRKAAPQISLVFDPFDPIAVELMRRNQLRFIRGLTAQQREATHRALVAGIAAGQGPEKISRTFKDSIGLTPSQVNALANFERQQYAQRQADLALPEAERPAIFTDAQIQARVRDHQRDLQLERAKVISRTEALRVTSLAHDEALRQGLEATGISRRQVVRVWNAHQDGRTRPDHAAADGQRRFLGEPFSIGGEQLDRPGDGSARNSVNCRCVLTEEVFDTTREAQDYRSGSPS